MPALLLRLTQWIHRHGRGAPPQRPSLQLWRRQEAQQGFSQQQRLYTGAVAAAAAGVQRRAGVDQPQEAGGERRAAGQLAGILRGRGCGKE